MEQMYLDTDGLRCIKCFPWETKKLTLVWQWSVTYPYSSRVPVQSPSLSHPSLLGCCFKSLPFPKFGFLL
jgi:hypothetical protein